MYRFFRLVMVSLPPVFPIIASGRLPRKRGNHGKEEQNNRQTNDEIVTKTQKKKQNVDKRNKTVYDVRALHSDKIRQNKAGVAF